MKRVILSIALLGIPFVAGCASAGTKIEASAANKITKGQTKAQVISQLGQPNSASLTGNGKEMLQWSYARSSVKGATFIPIVGLFAGGANVQLTTFQVVLGPDKLVEDTLWNNGSTDSRMGN